jgi:starch synthase
VARVGGLADTVVDAGEMALSAGVATGIQFSPVDRDSLSAAIEKAVTLWRDKPTWKRIQANGMATDVSWARPARRYSALYRDLIAASG